MRAWGTLLPFILVAGCTVGESRVVDITADETLPADLVPGDVVRKAGVEVVVPEAGQTVSAIAEMEDGTYVELGVRSPLEGAIELIQPPPADPLVLASGPTACSDGAYHLMGHKWNTTYQWSFWSGSTPAANSVANVEQALKNSAAAIVNSHNDCGLADQVGATEQYLGRTATAPGIKTANGTITCTGMDGKNVVGFGALPSGVLGIACAWSDGNNIALEGDVRLASGRSWYALAVPAGCSNRVGVQAVATHEFGHVFGLGHVSESLHGNLTMSTAAASCSNAPYTLGLGDVRALRALY